AQELRPIVSPRIAPRTPAATSRSFAGLLRAGSRLTLRSGASRRSGESDELRDFATRFGRVTWSSDTEFTCLCSAHDDHNPSTSARESDEGRKIKESKEGTLMFRARLYIRREKGCTPFKCNPLNLLPNEQSDQP